LKHSKLAIKPVLCALPFHELIKFLNCLKEFSNLKWFGSSFHVLAAKYLKVLNGMVAHATVN
jgi:hypothetical protein